MLWKCNFNSKKNTKKLFQLPLWTGDRGQGFDRRRGRGMFPFLGGDFNKLLQKTTGTVILAHNAIDSKQNPWLNTAGVCAERVDGEVNRCQTKQNKLWQSSAEC